MHEKKKTTGNVRHSDHQRIKIPSQGSDALVPCIFYGRFNNNNPFKSSARSSNNENNISVSHLCSIIDGIFLKISEGRGHVCLTPVCQEFHIIKSLPEIYCLARQEDARVQAVTS